MENNKTAVEFIIQKLRELAFNPKTHLGMGDIRVTQGYLDDLEEQAKEMEKEQIIDAFNASRGTVHGELYYTSAKSYYIEKYEE